MPLQPTPFPYQTEGILQIVNERRAIIADEPGLGKTLQALGAARLMEAHRVLIICPPILTTNWEKETHRSTNAENINGEIVAIEPRAKNSGDYELPKTGYAIVSDSLLTARPALQDRLAAWAPELLIVDEAHRLKNATAKRTRAVLKLGKYAARCLALTGTPIVSTPLDVLPLMQLTGTLHHTASNPRDFIDRYTYPAPWGQGRVPNRSALAVLHRTLDAHVWVRRTKSAVLKDLPPKLRTTHHVTPDASDAARGLESLHERIDEWLEKVPYPSASQIDEKVSDTLPYMSQLRRATGVAKVPATVAWVADHLDGAPDSPVIVWTIHNSVADEITTQIAQNRPQTRLRVINGGTPHQDRDEAVEAFQAGRVDVLVAQIIAAGVGLTLTRSTTALFAETDWTPANVVQAEDRIHRISQTEPVTITTLIADGTLDARIHAVLERNIQVLDHLTPGSDHRVTTGVTDTTSPSDLMRSIILDRINHHRRLANAA